MQASALRLGLVVLFAFCAIGRAAAVEAQMSDPEQCVADDKACIGAWYKEYSAGLLDEFKYYAGQEDFLAEMLADPQATLLTAKLSLLLVEGGTKSSQWALLKDEAAAKDAGLDMARYRAIVGPCRDAASGMRTALFDLREHRDNARAEAGQYLKDATACEKAFGLPPRLSKLRGKAQPARAPATSGPMEITPQKPRP
jgi:hypothetical protein